MISVIYPTDTNQKDSTTTKHMVEHIKLEIPRRASFVRTCVRLARDWQRRIVHTGGKLGEKGIIVRAEMEMSKPLRNVRNLEIIHTTYVVYTIYHASGVTNDFADSAGCRFHAYGDLRD